MAGALLWTERLSKRYGSMWAIRDLDLAVGEGEQAVFLGPPGSGKSTLLRILAGLVRPTSGRASVLGLDPVRHGHSLRVRLGYVPGTPRPCPHMTGAEFMDYSLAVRGLGPRAADSLVERLRPVMHLPLSRCDAGTARKLALVQALVAPTRVLLMDEPGEGLDHRARLEVRSLIQEAGAAGKAVLLSSRTPDLLGLVPDRVFLLDRGRIAVAGGRSVLDDRRFRIVTILFEPGAQLPRPESILGPGIADMEPLSRVCVRFREGEGRGSSEGYRMTVRGDWQDVLRRLSDHPLRDLQVDIPPLEAMFPDVYGGPDDELAFSGLEDEHEDYG